MFVKWSYTKYSTLRTYAGWLGAELLEVVSSRAQTLAQGPAHEAASGFPAWGAILYSPRPSLMIRPSLTKVESLPVMTRTSAGLPSSWDMAAANSPTDMVRWVSRSMSRITWRQP